MKVPFKISKVSGLTRKKLMKKQTAIVIMSIPKKPYRAMVKAMMMLYL